MLHCTIEPALKDSPIGHKNMVCQDRWSLVAGSVLLRSRSFCQNRKQVFQNRLSLMPVVSQDRFLCNWFGADCVLLSPLLP